MTGPAILRMNGCAHLVVVVPTQDVKGHWRPDDGFWVRYHFVNEAIPRFIHRELNSFEFGPKAIAAHVAHVLGHGPAFWVNTHLP